jgi:hypothetical protein
MKMTCTLRQIPLLTLLAAAFLTTALTLVVLADGLAYTLDWWTVDGGGGTLGGGAWPYALSGTIGQLDAGLALTGDSYALVGGFWGGGVAPEYPIYLPLVLRNH